MKIITIHLKKKVVVALLAVSAFNPVMAKSEVQMPIPEQVTAPQHIDHSKHLNQNQKYRGVFYGFLPCKDCEGVKTTLSLKNRNNYLLVTQPSKASAREFFDKGKYVWDEEAKLVTLTSRKKGEVRKYRINDEKTLTQVSSEGLSLKANQKNTSYILHRNKMVKRNQGGGHMH